MLRTNYLAFFLPIVLLFACGDANQQAADTEQQRENVTDGLFTPIASEASGLRFINTVKSDFSFNHISYSYLFNGAGIGVIDYDNDGLQDLFFVSNQDSNRLYRNLGDFKFEDVTATAGIAAPGGFSVGVSVADVDGDGWQDLCISRAGIDNSAAGKKNRENLLFINNGDGTFTEKAAELGLNSDRPATQATFFDYDLDGDLDMYQMNTPIDFANVNTVRVQRTANGVVRVIGPAKEWEADQLFRNDNGVFTDVSLAAGINNRAYGLSTVIYDFNRDGYPDIYLANDYIDDDNIYLNNGDGTFTEGAKRFLRHTSLNSMGSDLGDLNNDGLEDIVTLDMLAEPYQRKKQLESNMRPDRYNMMIRLGYSHQLMRNQLQLNNGLNFSEVGELAGIEATDWSWTPLLVDFDNDRRLDLFVANGYRYDLTDLDFISYTVDSIMALGGLSPKVFEDFSDFLDIMPSVPVANYLYRNKGQLSFENVAESWNVGEPSYSGSAVYADLNNDGAMDLVVGNHERPSFVYRNTATGNWLQVAPVGYTKNTKGFGVQVRLVLEDEQLIQRLQPTRGFLGSSEPLLHFGLGDMATIPRMEVTWPDGKTQLLTNVKANQRIEIKHADANGKAFKAEVAGADAGAKFNFPQGQRGIDFIHQENAFDDFDRQFLQPRMLSREGPSLAKSDVNGDGLQDVFIGGAAGTAAVLYRQNGNGRFVKSTPFAASANAHEDVAAVFFDADNDGDEDLYVASGGTAAAQDDPVYQDRLYLNNAGTFSLAENSLPAMYTPTGAVAAIDFDADGDLDLVVGGRGIPGSYPLSPRSYLLENNDGAFTDVTQLKFPQLTTIGMVTAIAIGDLLGDEQPEVVVAGEWMSLQTFSWDGEKFEQAIDGPQAGAGFWHSLLIEDLDGDGQAEVIAGNDGLNTRFQPSADMKVALYADDFDNNGAIDPILTFEDENGQMVPITTKAMMIKQLPKLKKKYVRARDYSKASIEAIFSTGELAGASVFNLETISSAVIRKSGDSWQVVDLPRMAQVAPARDIAVADFNGDGLKDLLLVGNDYGLQVETGRVDAGNGTLLLNDGNGGWSFSPNIKHGFWASLDARGVERVELADGKIGWVIVNNNGPAAIYEQE